MRQLPISGCLSFFICNVGVIAVPASLDCYEYLMSCFVLRAWNSGQTICTQICQQGLFLTLVFSSLKIPTIRP